MQVLYLPIILWNDVLMLGILLGTQHLEFYTCHVLVSLGEKYTSNTCGRT